MCAWKEWHGEAGTDLGAENERRPLDWLTAGPTHLTVQLGTLQAVGIALLSQLALTAVLCLGA